MMSSSLDQTILLQSPVAIASLALQPALGLVCITNSQAVRFKTLTRTRFLQMSPPEQAEKLRSLYQENLLRLHAAIDFCVTHQIRLYRLISNLFPFSDTPLGAAILDEMAESLRQVGDRAQSEQIRLVLHPDQEAKHKEVAIAKLREDWRPCQPYP